MRKGIIAICLFTLLLQESLAEENNQTLHIKDIFHQLKFGVLAHDIDDLWSGTRREDGVDLNIEAIFSPAYTIFSGTLRPAIGGSINTAGDTSKGYIDMLWQYDFNTNIFFIAGIGAAVHTGEKQATSEEKKALGSRILFHVPLELGYYVTPKTTVSMYFDHISNAGTADENEGLDTLGLRFGYIF